MSIRVYKIIYSFGHSKNKFIEFIQGENLQGALTEFKSERRSYDGWGQDDIFMQDISVLEQNDNKIELPSGNRII